MLLDIEESIDRYYSVVVVVVDHSISTLMPWRRYHHALLVLIQVLLLLDLERSYQTFHHHFIEGANNMRQNYVFEFRL